MNKNRIEGAAEQGERAVNREALVIKARWRKSGGRAVKECVLTRGDLALWVKVQRSDAEREVSRGRSSCRYGAKGRTRRSVQGHVDARGTASDVRASEAGWGVHGEAAHEPTSDEADCPRRATKDTGSALLEAALTRENLQRAWKRVKADKGKPGVDGLDIDQTARRLVTQWPVIREQLLQGRYRPSPVLRVTIPKPDGGERELGIPTVTDRLIQQAVLQVLQPILDPSFSKSSYGFVRLRRILRYAQDQPLAVLRPSGWSTRPTCPRRDCRGARVYPVWAADRGGC